MIFQKFKNFDLSHNIATRKPSVYRMKGIYCDRVGQILLFLEICLPWGHDSCEIEKNVVKISASPQNTPFFMKNDLF